MKYLSLLKVCSELVIHYMLLLLITTGSLSAEHIDRYRPEKQHQTFFFIDKSISMLGRNFSNSVYLKFTNNFNTESVNFTIVISEEQWMNSSIIIINVNDAWQYKLKLSIKSEDLELACTQAVSFLRTTASFLNIERIKAKKTELK